MVPSNSAKDTPIQEQDAVKSLTDSVQDKPKKIKLDSKPAKVGGFVSRFPQNTKKPEVSGEAAKGSESKLKTKSRGDTGGVLGNLYNTSKGVSKQKKRKHKDVDNFDAQRPKKEKITLVNVDDSEAISSNQETDGLSNAANDSSKEGKQDVGSVDVLNISSKLRKPEEKAVEKNLDSLSKQKKISRGERAMGKDDERAIDESSSKELGGNSVKIVGTSSATSLGGELQTGGKLQNGRKELYRAKSNAVSKKKKKLTKRSDLDKRSGALGVKVIKRNHRKGKPINIEALERNEGYDFGVGEGSGW